MIRKTSAQEGSESLRVLHRFKGLIILKWTPQTEISAASSHSVFTLCFKNSWFFCFYFPRSLSLLTVFKDLILFLSCPRVEGSRNLRTQEWPCPANTKIHGKLAVHFFSSPTYFNHWRSRLLRWFRSPSSVFLSLLPMPSMHGPLCGHTTCFLEKAKVPPIYVTLAMHFACCPHYCRTRSSVSGQGLWF